MTLNVILHAAHYVLMNKTENMITLFEMMLSQNAIERKRISGTPP